MAWMTTYILISIVGFYALLSLLLVARMLKFWVSGSTPKGQVRHPSLPHWTPPREAITAESQEHHLSA